MTRKVTIVGDPKQKRVFVGSDDKFARTIQPRTTGNIGYRRFHNWQPPFHEYVTSGVIRESTRSGARSLTQDMETLSDI